jgi:hypothetical protein
MRTLFDCDTCEAARDRIAELETENRWLRRYVTIPGCVRCRVSMVYAPCGYTDRHGYTVGVCSQCWRPGDHLDLRHGVRLRVITALRLVVEHPDGDTDIVCHRGEQPVAIEHWAQSWSATGLVSAAQPGGGIGCRGEAVSYVLDQLSRR